MEGNRIKNKTKRHNSNVSSTDDLLPEKDFLERYDIPPESFVETGLSWDVLTQIFQDYNKLKHRLEYSAKAIVDILFAREARENGIHSVRFRIKDSNSLIEKIIRKKIKDPQRDINLKNYIEEITDLIGIRALHVFKNDLYGIHHFITEMFALKEGETPIHYHREGDSEDFLEMCKGIGCKQEKHNKGYRSVHYIVSTQLTKKNYYAEIQVRTIFEEGWSEIDHKIRYSYKNNPNPQFDSQLRALNGIAGNADEIGTIIKSLEQSEQQRILGSKKGKR